jgi:hypothetical protein
MGQITQFNIHQINIHQINISIMKKLDCFIAYLLIDFYR